jgi:hypothetical protein
VTKLASSEARKTAALAISSGVADAAERDPRGHLVQQLLLPRGVGARQADQAGGPRGAGAEDVHADAAPFRSRIQLRAKARTAAFDAA